MHALSRTIYSTQTTHLLSFALPDLFGLTVTTQLILLTPTNVDLVPS